jgi:hypothetical protein
MVAPLRLADPAMPDEPPPSRGRALAELDEAIARAELQLMLLGSVLVLRADTGRESERLRKLAKDTDRRLAVMYAERKRSRSKR